MEGSAINYRIISGPVHVGPSRGLIFDFGTALSFFCLGDVLKAAERRNVL